LEWLVLSAQQVSLVHLVHLGFPEFREFLV
jgi:hypothetical protein